ncbi:hypothetical protein [Dictyobacter arantiisoli]|uniref:hypothetical protein n=1 Tax=Dictyobacter arantiisoli TaxID=2014874 RepID=UPI00155A245C|nr:hypothetical protein [Dictyobacter arantiisoli]
MLDAVLRYTQACAPSSDSAYLRNWHAGVVIDETTMGTGCTIFQVRNHSLHIPEHARPTSQQAAIGMISG